MILLLFYGVNEHWNQWLGLRIEAQTRLVLAGMYVDKKGRYVLG